MNPIALRALADAADALARLAREAAAESPADPTAMVPLVDAAQIAGTSMRIVRDAIRSGDLAAFGRQRDRSVRRGDLDRWIESRRLRPVSGVDDPDMERRVRRLTKMTSGEHDDGSKRGRHGATGSRASGCR